MKCPSVPAQAEAYALMRWSRMLIAVYAVVSGSLVSTGCNPSYDRRRALVDALENKDLPEVRRQLESGADPSTSAPDGLTPLLLYAAEGSSNDVNYVLERGVEVNWTDRHGDSPLHHAVTRGQLEMTRLLLRRGADPDARGSWDDTALHVVSRANVPADTQLAIVKELLQHGAGIDAQDRSGRTALMGAVMEDRTELLALLLREGANWNLRYLQRDTAIDMADGHGYGRHLKALRLLRLASRKRLAPLRDRLADAVRRKDAVQVDTLLREGAKANQRAQNGVPILQSAIEQGDLPTVRVLLRRGAHINLPDAQGVTPLIRAASAPLSNLCLVHLLLATGANPVLQDARGNDALAYARRAGWEDRAKALWTAKQNYGKAIEHR